MIYIVAFVFVQNTNASNKIFKLNGYFKSFLCQDKKVIVII